MSGRSFLLAGLVLLAPVAAACSGRGDGKPAGKPPVAVEVAAASPQDIARSVEVVGSLEPRQSADVKSEFTAVIAEVYVTEWVAVKKGTPLARLDTREGEATVAAAHAAYLQAEVGATRARRELERAEQAKTLGLITQQSLDDARSAAEAAHAATAAAQAQQTLAETRLAKAVVRAPIDGVVSQRGVDVGDRVENMGGNGSMFTIVDNRQMRLTATVPASRLGELRVGQSLEFSTDALPGRTFHGTVAFINPSLDVAARSVRVRAEVDNPDGALRGGMFVKGRILTGTRTAVLQIPRAALLSWDVERQAGEVFVVKDELAERRTVRTGVLSGDAVEIVDGLVAGEPVVVRGAFNLRPGDRVAVAAAGAG